MVPISMWEGQSAFLVERDGKDSRSLTLSGIELTNSSV